MTWFPEVSHGVFRRRIQPPWARHFRSSWPPSNWAAEPSVEADPAGAYDLYACAARLARRVRGLSEVADFRLDRALDESESRSDPAGRAAALREAFDSLLPDIAARAAAGRPAGGHPAVHRDGHLHRRAGVQPRRPPGLLRRLLLHGPDDPGDPGRCGPRPDAPAPGPRRMRSARRLQQAGVGDAAWVRRGPGNGRSNWPGGAWRRAEVRHLACLAMAIQIGAPAFNLGDGRGCYEVYACTARLLVHGANVANEVKDRLRKTLEQASVVPDVTRQAWIMRHAFDSLLGEESGEAAAEELDGAGDESED